MHLPYLFTGSLKAHQVQSVLSNASPLKGGDAQSLGNYKGSGGKAYTRLSLSTYLQIERGDRKFDNALTHLLLTQTHQSSRKPTNSYNAPPLEGGDGRCLHNFKET
jgi:hypothetical protein